MDPDSFKTLAASAEGEYRAAGSRFIGLAVPVQNREEAEEHLQSRRKSYFDATHHCYAYRLGTGMEETFRYADAGEPAGTAGRPIFNVLVGRELTDILLVVTRYFGGVKLGTGGLARAYAETARLTLDQAPVQVSYLTETLEFQIDYEHSHTVNHLLELLQAKVVKSDYRDQIRLAVKVRRSLAERFQTLLIEATNGRVLFTRL